MIEEREDLQSPAGKVTYSTDFLHEFSTGSKEMMIRAGLIASAKNINDDTDERFLLSMLRVPNSDGVK